MASLPDGAHAATDTPWKRQGASVRRLPARKPQSRGAAAENLSYAVPGIEYATAI